MIISVVPLVRLPVGIGPFSYTTDEDTIAIGTAVHIVFRARKRIGIVVAVHVQQTANELPSLQPIQSLLARTPLVSEAWCRSLFLLAAVYHVNPSTLSISLVPSIGPRMVSDKTLKDLPTQHRTSSAPIAHTIVDDGSLLDNEISNMIQADLTSTRIIICPNASTVERIAHALHALTPYVYTRGGSTKKAKIIWHAVRNGEACTVVGTRAAAFLPFAPGAKIFVVNPQDDGHTQWDAQPYATTLDVLTIRARNEFLNIRTIAHTATTEQLLEKEQWTRAWNPVPVAFQKIDNAQLVRARLYHAIPDPVRDCIAEATPSNPVVILVNRTDESVLLRCADCDTVIPSRTATTCPHCHGATVRAHGLTISYLARIAQEQFPHMRVVQMQADQATPQEQAHIIVATNTILHAAILSQASVVWVPGADSRFSRPWYRAIEHALYQFRELAARAPQAELLVSTWNAENPLWSALQDIDALRRFFAAELQSRKIHHYPPYVRLVRITRAALPKGNKSAITGTTTIHRLHPTNWIDELSALTPSLAREDRVEPNPLSP
jgi:primosomal protein N'